MCVAVGSARPTRTRTKHTHVPHDAHTHKHTHTHVHAQSIQTDQKVLMAWVTCQCRVPPDVVSNTRLTRTHCNTPYRSSLGTAYYNTWYMKPYCSILGTGYWVLHYRLRRGRDTAVFWVLGTEYYITGYIEVEILQYSVSVPSVLALQRHAD